ncbi:hypothetical protein XM38_048620 [Halomicronema hongdechloris C2206]|uniref:DUF3082 domain-containing protein n=1 Tax=Halomicronema hongdechloris C2206 TaxID=1641165 RepID=A0A1Z3HU95_9CYAN|nr:DUF3082 domain-containing protein [Halomicronema hongdechloris]ASC73888.1 hypothetical protein XM38_048620 [Halomicronema hongdechloris C2206]
MDNSPTPKVETSQSTPTPPAKIWRCFSGAFIAGSLGMILYRFMTTIAVTFANKPVTSDNPAVVNISAAVRTLVVGIVALGAGVFAIAAVGLFLLGMQLAVQRLMGRSKSSSQT